MNDKSVKKICFVNLFARELFIQNNIDKPVSFGGAEVQIYQLSKHLAESTQYSVHLLTAGPRPFTMSYCNNVYVHSVLSLETKWGLLSKIAMACRLIIGIYRMNADVYIQRAVGFETFLIGLYARIYKKKFIYMIAHEWDISGEYIRRHKVIGRLALRGIKWATQIIAQNNDQKVMLNDNYKLSSIVFPSLHSIPLHTLPLENRDYILWVGRAETWKQPEIFLKLTEAMPNESFVMIIPKGNYPDLYQQILNKASHLKNLTLITSVPFTQIDDYFQKAKVFVNTSTMEGFPNTFVQATKYGTPIVSLYVNPDNIIQSCNLGTITNNEDIDTLASAVSKLISSSERYLRIRDNCTHYAKDNHDIKKFGKEFAKLI